METGAAALEKEEDVSEAGIQEQPAENIASTKTLKNTGILFCPIIFS